MINQQHNKNSYLFSITVIGVLFFIFGFITWLNGTLIPFLKIACELNTMESMFVAFAFYIAYFFTAIPMSYVLKKTGFKNGMSWGLVIMAVGALLFIPAAQTRYYPLFLAGLFIQGTGLSLLQTASNPYVIILGPIESAAQRISIMGIANKVAGMISPVILANLVLENTKTISQQLEKVSSPQIREILLNQIASSVITPYIFIAIFLIILAFILRTIQLPDVDTNTENNSVESIEKKSLLQYPHFILGVLALFLYVGAEVIAGDTIILYGIEQWNIPIEKAKFFTSFTLLSMIAGYLIGIFAIPKFISQQKALTYFAIIGVVFTILAVFTNGFMSVLFIAALGFANSIMWPAIFPLSINGLGKYTKLASAIMIMAIAGGALLPIVYGKLTEFIGRQQAYYILLPCYLYIFYFGVMGFKMGKK